MDRNVSVLAHDADAVLSLCVAVVSVCPSSELKSLLSDYSSSLSEQEQVRTWALHYLYPTTSKGLDMPCPRTSPAYECFTSSPS